MENPKDVKSRKEPEFGQMVCIIGGAHQGKSYYAKSIIQKGNCFVYDYQDCYGDTSTKAGDIVTGLPLIKDYNGLKSLNRCRFGGDHQTFLELAHLCRNRTIIIEEATIFFQGQTEQGMRKLMVDRFHHKNNILIMFHSINAVNPRILEMSNYVVLFKTGDAENIVKRKYDILTPHYLGLKGKPDRSKVIVKII